MTAHCCICVNANQPTEGITRPFWLCDAHTKHILELIDRAKDRANSRGRRITMLGAQPRAHRIPAPDHWTEHAACRSHDPELWFPIARTGCYSARTRAAAEPARAICRTCPVIENCLTHALNAPEPAGVWGGLDEHEREALQQRRKATP